MKIAVLDQPGPCITVLTRFVTNACPSLMRFGGCSLTASLGTTNDTCGSVPNRACKRNVDSGWTLPSSSSSWTVVNAGSGFQYGRVLDAATTGLQTASPV